MSFIHRKIFWFWVYVVLMLGVFTFLVPPFQKPDEILHFKRAAALAKGQITCMRNRETDERYFRFPKSIDELPSQMLAGHIIMNTEGRFPINLLKGPYPLSWNGYQTDLLYNCVSTIPSYIPHALGILISIPFNSVLISFFLARVVAAIMYAGLLFLALRIAVKPYHYFVALTGGLPMTLFLGSSVSYDSLSIPLGILVFAYLTKLYSTKAISVKILLWFMATLLVFVAVKPGYYLILALPILFITQIMNHIGLGKTIALFSIYSFVSFCVLWFILTMPI